MATPKKSGIVIKVTMKTVDGNPFAMKPDDLLADDFLWGWVNPTIKTRSRSYFAEGGALELKGRQALIRVLRSDQPLNQLLRRHLAELFEVKSTAAERKLVIAFRRDRKRSNPMVKQDIANFVERTCEELAGQPKAMTIAIAEAAQHFGVTTKTIYKHLRLKKSPPVGRKG
jgi:hypothetical protein